MEGKKAILFLLNRKKRSSSLPKKERVNLKSSILEKSLRTTPEAYTGGQFNSTISQKAYLHTKIEEQKLKKYLELKRSLNKDAYEYIYANTREVR